MPGMNWHISIVVVAAASLLLCADEAKYPHARKYIEDVKRIKLPLQEAINRAVEEHPGIPIAASLEMSEEEEGRFIFWIEIIESTRGGATGNVWGIAMDAQTGEMEETENITRDKEKEFREEQRNRKANRWDVRRFIAEARKAQLPLQEAIGRVTEEHGGTAISASLEASEEEEGELLFWIEAIRPPKGDKPASIWGFSLEANTGELRSMENVTREKDREFCAIEKKRKEEKEE